MGDLFKKKGPHIKKSPYEEALKDAANTQRATGQQYAELLKPYGAMFDQIARKEYATEYGDRYRPFRDTYLDIARDPVDDELTQFFREEYGRSVRDRLGDRGLLGQGSGEAQESDAMRRFFLDARDRADARRNYGMGGATNIDEMLRMIELGDAQRKQTGAQSLDWLGKAIQSQQGAGTPLYSGLYQTDSANKAWEAAAKEASLTPFDEILRNVNNVTTTLNNQASLVGSIYGMGAGGGMGGMGGGGGGGGKDLQLGGQAAPAWGGGYNLWGQQPGAGGGQMTPWGAPASSGGSYSLSAPADDDWGGAMARSGRYRFISG